LNAEEDGVAGEQEGTLKKGVVSWFHPVGLTRDPVTNEVHIIMERDEQFRMPIPLHTTMFYLIPFTEETSCLWNIYSEFLLLLKDAVLVDFGSRFLNQFGVRRPPGTLKPLVIAGWSYFNINVFRNVRIHAERAHLTQGQRDICPTGCKLSVSSVRRAMRSVLSPMALMLSDYSSPLQDREPFASLGIVGKHVLDLDVLLEALSILSIVKIQAKHTAMEKRAARIQENIAADPQCTDQMSNTACHQLAEFRRIFSLRRPEEDWDRRASSMRNRWLSSYWDGPKRKLTYYIQDWAAGKKSRSFNGRTAKEKFVPISVTEAYVVFDGLPFAVCPCAGKRRFLNVMPLLRIREKFELPFVLLHRVSDRFLGILSSMVSRTTNHSPFFCNLPGDTCMALCTELRGYSPVLQCIPDTEQRLHLGFALFAKSLAHQLCTGRRFQRDMYSALSLADLVYIAHRTFTGIHLKKLRRIPDKVELMRMPLWYEGSRAFDFIALFSERYLEPYIGKAGGLIDASDTVLSILSFSDSGEETYTTGTRMYRPLVLPYLRDMIEKSRGLLEDGEKFRGNLYAPILQYPRSLVPFMEDRVLVSQLHKLKSYELQGRCVVDLQAHTGNYAASFVSLRHSLESSLEYAGGRFAAVYPGGSRDNPISPAIYAGKLCKSEGTPEERTVDGGGGAADDHDDYLDKETLIDLGFDIDDEEEEEILREVEKIDMTERLVWPSFSISKIPKKKFSNVHLVNLEAFSIKELSSVLRRLLRLLRAATKKDFSPAVTFHYRVGTYFQPSDDIVGILRQILDTSSPGRVGLLDHLVPSSQMFPAIGRVVVYPREGLHRVLNTAEGPTVVGIRVPVAEHGQGRRYVYLSKEDLRWTRDYWKMGISPHSRRISSRIPVCIPYTVIPFVNCVIWNAIFDAGSRVIVSEVPRHVDSAKLHETLREFYLTSAVHDIDKRKDVGNMYRCDLSRNARLFYLDVTLEGECIMSTIAI